MWVPKPWGHTTDYFFFKDGVFISDVALTTAVYTRYVYIQKACILQ